LLKSDVSHHHQNTETALRIKARTTKVGSHANNLIPIKWIVFLTLVVGPPQGSIVPAPWCSLELLSHAGCAIPTSTTFLLQSTSSVFKASCSDNSVFSFLGTHAGAFVCHLHHNRRGVIVAVIGTVKRFALCSRVHGKATTCVHGLAYVRYCYLSDDKSIPLHIISIGTCIN
jgi:hypothetical protein